MDSDSADKLGNCIIWAAVGLQVMILYGSVIIVKHLREIRDAIQKKEMP